MAMKLLKEWGNEIRKNKQLIIFSLFLCVLATVINYNAGDYVTSKGGTTVGDFFIDNFAQVDLTWLFVYGWLVVVAVLVFYPLLFDVGSENKALSEFSLLLIVRSFFITLTHLGTPAGVVAVGFPGATNLLQFTNDLFFSGHTAVSFLGFLVFKGKKIRWFFLIASIVMGATVLLMHQHYTIDVLAAFFITYGTYKIGNYLFGAFERKK